MNLDQLVTKVQVIVQDSTSFDGDFITDLLNLGMLRVAGGIKRPDSFSRTQPLPDLYTIGTVTTQAALNYVGLPANYQRALVLAFNKDGVELKIRDSFQEFARGAYPNLTWQSSPNELGLKGRTLYYRGIPTVPEIITIHYHRYPIEMSADEDEPDGLPPEYHDSILVNFACSEVYRLIEDGIDGNDFNTKRYFNLFQAGVLDMESGFPADGESFTTDQNPNRWGSRP